MYYFFKNGQDKLRMEVDAFKGITHILIGISFFMAVENYFFLAIDGIIILTCIVLGSLLPDIDHPGSKLGRYAYPVSSVVQHRGFTHSLIAALILPLPAILISTRYYLPLVAGYLLHLLADTLNPSGVMWLYPYKRKYSLKLANTGGLEEVVFSVMAIMFIFSSIFK